MFENNRFVRSIAAVLALAMAPNDQERQLSPELTPLQGVSVGSMLSHLRAQASGDQYHDDGRPDLSRIINLNPEA